MVGVVAFVADRVSKWYVVTRLTPFEGDSISLVGTWLRITHVHNTGVAFGMFTNRNLLLGLLALAVLVVMVAFYRQLPRDIPWLTVSLGLQVGGAIGNLVDRLRQGYVTDFIQVPHWPVFNIGDSCICVGVTMLALYLLFQGESQPARQEKQRHDHGRVRPHPRVSD